MHVSGSARLLFLVVTIARKNECLCQHSFFILSSNGQDVQISHSSSTSTSPGMRTSYTKTGWRESYQLCKLDEDGKKCKL
jgi:hypothetical protein